jgi:hypothetical protein
MSRLVFLRVAKPGHGKESIGSAFELFDPEGVEDGR